MHIDITVTKLNGENFGNGRPSGQCGFLIQWRTKPHQARAKRAQKKLKCPIPLLSPKDRSGIAQIKGPGLVWALSRATPQSRIAT